MKKCILLVWYEIQTDSIVVGALDGDKKYVFFRLACGSTPSDKKLHSIQSLLHGKDAYLSLDDASTD